MTNTYNSVNPQQIIKINNGTNATTLGAISGGANWVSNSNGYAISPNVTVNNNPSSLEVHGKIIHNGQDLEERLKTIEKVLAIPEKDVILESKYPKLKKMYDDYINELSKARMWESLKGNQNE